jgi:hypothetical protein
MLERIKKAVNESVKSVIVEIEDHQLRDDLLNYLTLLSTRGLDLDDAISKIMDCLV